MHTVCQAGSHHTRCNASIHAPIKEANRSDLRLIFVANEAIQLVVRLRRIDGKNLKVGRQPRTFVS